jgi:hypothetical protein
MAHYLNGDSKYRGSRCADEEALHLRGYPLGRGCSNFGRGRSALDRANSYFKNLIQSIADAKLRRMGRELELRCLSLDGPDEAWIPNSLRKGNGAQ